MPPIGDDAVERIRRDHERMLQLVERIRSECTEQGKVDHCNDCTPNRRGVCQGNIEQLIRTFVETTLKHNVIESMFMEEVAPAAHRLAHNRAHMEIALQLKAIRVIFSEDGNGVQAIEGIDQIHQALLTHFEDYDLQLEGYLRAIALTPQA